MADQEIAAKSPEERRAAAEADARILAEAKVIRQSEERYGLAREIAAEMAMKSDQEAKALSEIASGVLNYPSLENQGGEIGVPQA